MKNTALIEVVYEEVGHQIPRSLPVLRRRREGKGLILSFADPGHILRRHSLNRVSMQVYELCDGRRSVSEIRSLMQAAYPQLAPTLIAQHVVRAIRVLDRKGILVLGRSV